MGQKQLVTVLSGYSAYLDKMLNQGITSRYFYDLSGRMMRYTEKAGENTYSLTYSYDNLNNLSTVMEDINGATRRTAYTYDDNNRVIKIGYGTAWESYTYDAYGRVATRINTSGDTEVLTDTLTYRELSGIRTSGQVYKLETSTAANAYNASYTYTYDANGNILSVKDKNNKTTSYVYDSANQLVRENNQAAGKTWVWAYDNAGNIENRQEYAYTTETLGTRVDFIDYAYEDADWGDLLTKYDGQTISYDAIGIPTSYYNSTNWSMAREHTFTHISPFTHRFFSCIIFPSTHKEFAMYQKSDLIRHIKALGIQPSDTIMVHTSLKSVGIIAPEDKSTAEIYIEALKECVPEGLLLIPTHTWATVREDGQLFDVRTSLPCIGAVPSVAVKLAEQAHDAGRTDCLRSLHPTHSVVAFGKRAAEYISGDQFAETPAPKGGCFGKLYEENAKILLVGVNHGRNTFFHAVDEYLDIPNRLCDSPIHPIVRDYDGNETPRVLTRHSHSMSDFFMNYEVWLEENDAVHFGRIGDALTRVCDAKKCTHAIARIWEHADRDLCEKNEILDLTKLIR